jgi:hypothetical protein
MGLEEKSEEVKNIIINKNLHEKILKDDPRFYLKNIGPVEAFYVIHIQPNSK